MPIEYGAPAKSSRPERYPFIDISAAVRMPEGMVKAGYRLIARRFPPHEGHHFRAWLMREGRTVCFCLRCPDAKELTEIIQDGGKKL